MTASVQEAYERCEAITRDQARNFYYGIRLLRPQRRAALCALYALARRIDDIGDDPEQPAAEKAIALARVRRDLANLSTSSDAVLVAVGDAARRYPVPLEAFGELVDGVQMDIDGRRFASFDELAVYCRCVAGSIGRLCLGVFGSRPDPHAAEYADALASDDAVNEEDTLGSFDVVLVRPVGDRDGDSLVARPAQPSAERPSLSLLGVIPLFPSCGPPTIATLSSGLPNLTQKSADDSREWHAHGARNYDGAPVSSSRPPRECDFFYSVRDDFSRLGFSDLESRGRFRLSQPPYRPVHRAGGSASERIGSCDRGIFPAYSNPVHRDRLR